MNEALTYSVDYMPYLTYQANLFDDYGECWFNGTFVCTRDQYEREYDL